MPLAREALALAVAAGVLIVAAAPPAQADPCNRPDLIDAMPPDEAEGVPTDATLFARYRTTAEYLGEDVILEHVGVGERVVDASFDASEGMLSVVPPGGLLAGESYVIEWPELRGVSTASLGFGRSVEFSVGAGPDQESPSFGGLTGLDWDWERERDECNDQLEDRFVFDLDLSEASDDGGRESLTLIVFQTEGPNVDPEAPEPVFTGRIPDEGDPVTVVRRVDDAVGKICFAAVVRDLTGKISGGGNTEVCADAESPPFFDGCALGASGWGHARSAWWAVLLLALWARVRRRVA